MPIDEATMKKIREEYGDEPLVSAPVDPENPSFDSLLGALRAVHTGEMHMDVLVRYHDELNRQLAESREFYENMEVDEYSREVRDLSLGSVNIIQITLNLLEEYIDDPTEEKMADCLDSLLTSRSINQYVHDVLDENIKKAGLKQ